jgi:hypothetical protein
MPWILKGAKGLMPIFSCKKISTILVVTTEVSGLLFEIIQRNHLKRKREKGKVHIIKILLIIESD